MTRKNAFLSHLPRVIRTQSEQVYHHLQQVSVLIRYKKKADLFGAQQMSNISITDHFPCIQTVACPLRIHQLKTLIETSQVQKLFLDRPIATCLHIATPTISAPAMKITENQGEGVTIAILDTGIATHPDLDSRLIHFVDFVNGKQKPYDDNGHGTHCAGCAGSSGKSSNGRFRGIAPKAKLIGIKVLGKQGESNISDVIRGIYWCIQNKAKYNIRVISLSLGSTGELAYTEDPLCLMAEFAHRAGIVVVAAAGNAGPALQTISSPGNHPAVITVGATNDQRTITSVDDQIAAFSSRGPTHDGYTKPDLVAPGTNIISLRSESSFLDASLASNRVNQHYFALSGTSMATPIVAGVAALLLTKNPNLTPDEVKQCLMQTATSLHQPDNVQGKGLIDAHKALELV